MAVHNHIRNPIEFIAGQFGSVGRAAGHSGEGFRLTDDGRAFTHLPVRRIAIRDLWDALARGWSDLGAFRTDAIFLCVIYPVAGLVLARAAVDYGLLPLIFPLASGFALLGPFAAVGLYELSRRREEGGGGGAAQAFGVVRAPAFGSILMLGLVLFGLFLAWLAAAYAIYHVTLGPEPPTSIAAFASDVFTTPGGWTMIGAGIGVGFVFAVAALAIGVVSFPLLLDRNVGLFTAVATSVRAVAANPVTMAAWGLIVAAGLVIGSIPALIGLVVVMPVLGHATWHLYRRLVPRDPQAA